MPETVKLVTPDHIELEYQLAGLGTRFLAVFIDHLLQFGATLIVVLAFTPVEFVGTGLLTAIYIFILFTIWMGYFILFEWLMRGQTLGKKLTGLRVMRDDGRPADAAAAIIRNIVRLADFLPVAYTAGIISVFFNPQLKRLGDLAAGTIVVIERPLQSRAQPFPDQRKEDVSLNQPRTVTIVGLAREDREAALMFLQRRHELQAPIRRELAERISGALAEKAGYTRDQVLQDPEGFLEAVVRSE